MKNFAWARSGPFRRAAIAVLAWASATAWAAKVGDLPGGPAVNQLNLHPPVTSIARDIAALHWFVLIICTIIFIGVFGVMFYSIWAHRKSRGAKSAKWHESIPVEVTWTLVPFILEVFMAMPATKIIVAQKDTTNSDITIKATGYQWKWGYEYLDGEGAGIKFLSTLDPEMRELSNAGTPKGDDYLLRVDNPLVLPVDKKIRVITTANDVIHAWFVPSFGVKQDAIPGFVRDTWFRAEKTGDYYGQCAELCGKEHAYMPIHVKILPQEEYAAWVAKQQGQSSATGAAAGNAQSTQAAAPALAGPYQVFFASGNSAIDEEGSAALKQAVDYFLQNVDFRIRVSGFVDSTGSAEVNQRLARERAQAVHDALVAQGIPAERIEMRKPESVTASQVADREARRVDIAAAS